MRRIASHSGFDAAIDLFPPRDVPTAAYVLVKRTFALTSRGIEPADPEPLFHDLRDETVTPRLQPGSDFWPFKAATDVVVQGSAFSPGGNPTRQMVVSVRVGDGGKRVAVFGRRRLEWTTDGQPRIGDPEPFVDMPLTYRNAYGGYDGRVSTEGVPAEQLQMDHPGLYPRNLFGKGYVVLGEPVEGVDLPNLEDPDDLLTQDRVLVGAPELWYRQPLPWCFDWVNPLQFPRLTHLGLSPWFPAPDDARLPEVRRGLFSFERHDRVHNLYEFANGPVPLAYFQEASLGMVFDDLTAGTPVVVEGMHPQHPRLEFSLPPPPSVEIELAGRRREAATRLTNVLIKPSEARLSLVYSALEPDLHVTYIPGIHSRIPLAAHIDAHHCVPYATPPTIRSLLRNGQQKDTSK